MAASTEPFTYKSLFPVVAFGVMKVDSGATVRFLRRRLTASLTGRRPSHLPRADFLLNRATCAMLLSSFRCCSVATNNLSSCCPTILARVIAFLTKARAGSTCSGDPVPTALVRWKEFDRMRMFCAAFAARDRGSLLVHDAHLQDRVVAEAWGVGAPAGFFYFTRGGGGGGWGFFGGEGGGFREGGGGGFFLTAGEERRVGFRR